MNPNRRRREAPTQARGSLDALHPEVGPKLLRLRLRTRQQHPNCMVTPLNLIGTNPPVTLGPHVLDLDTCTYRSTRSDPTAFDLSAGAQKGQPQRR